MIEELDNHNQLDLRLSNYGTFEKLGKTQQIIDQTISNQFKRLYNVENMSYLDLHNAYSSMNSGFANMANARAHFLRNGMSAQFADILAAKHIKHLEQG